MLKTMKSKVIAGAVAVGVLSGGGAVLGATDAGTALKGWYDAKFGSAAASVTVDTANYAKGKIPGLAAEYQGIKNNTSSQLKAKGQSDADATNKSIDDQSKRYIEQINSKKAEIDTYLSGQFDSLASYAQGLINTSGSEALSYANKDLKSHADAEGKKAIEDVNVKVKGATAEAASKLQAAIDEAKASLQSQLDSEQAATTAEIKQMIDTKIEEVRVAVNATNNALVKENKKLITMTAKALLLDGQNQLDGIVGNINK